MTCRDLYGFLDAFLEGSLEAATRATFEAHLLRCAACRRYLQSYQRTVEIARAAETSDTAAHAHALTGAPEELIRAILRARAVPADGDRK